MSKKSRQNIALELKNIVKVYGEGEFAVKALKGVSLDFRTNEFVSILGPSGCGKTTMLNIVGGLDKYTDGDLVINGVSTKQYGDRDWDAYRNHSIGFVFQNYNLIPHQSVLKNVELALTIAGVNKDERKARAVKALEQVGLKEQIYKRPNQLSGGQMQRVAIARALVNNPDIILADEPTGALDTETSLSVMELLRKIADDRLVIMVTHNPELAEKYSTRIIRMLDGKIVDDSMPVSKEEKAENEKALNENKSDKKADKKPTMSFWTAFKLSLKNLITKRARTMLTSFAGSIGIIGIALILAVSQGATGYINHVQETTLSSYPLTIQAESLDIGSLMQTFLGLGGEDKNNSDDLIYKDSIISDMVNALSKSGSNKNDLKAFKKYLEDKLANSDLKNSVTGVQYGYDLNLQIYTRNVDGTIIKSDTNELIADMIADYMKSVLENGKVSEDMGNNTGSLSMMGSFSNATALWKELLPGQEDGEVINKMITDNYELIDGGSWPNEHDEVVLIVNENNELDDLTLFALGLLSQEEIDAIIDAAAKKEPLKEEIKTWTFEEIRSRTYKTILPADKYQNRGDGVFIDTSELFLESLYERSLELKVTGIIRPKADTEVKMLRSGIGYTHKLTEYVIEQSKNTEVVKAQQQNPKVDVLSGLPFESNTGSMTNEEKKLAFIDYVNDLSIKDKANVYVEILAIQEEANSLEQKVNDYLIKFNTIPEFKAQIMDTVITAYANKLGVDKEVLLDYIGEATEEELLVYAVPVFTEMSKMEIRQEVMFNLTLTEEERALALDQLLASDGVSDQDFGVFYDRITVFSNNTYDGNLTEFSCVNLDEPTSINIYVASFDDRAVVLSYIDEYNKNLPAEDQISNEDYVGDLMSSISDIVDAVTYVLISFVAISLVVSSIMIGVITLISVQERTKEIGILRAIGASKRDVSSMFNAETLIIGFASGLLGVLITYLLCIPINFILRLLTGLATLKAVLPLGAAIALILISMALTLFSGLIPSRSAAKKDPVVALRTE